MDVKITSSGRTFPVKNERGKTIGDCVCRALTNFLDMPYSEVHDMLTAETSYKTYEGIDSHEIISYMKKLGFTYHVARIRINSATADNKLPRKCILYFLVPSLGKGHFAYYEDGVITDTFDTRRGKTTKQTVGYFTAD